MSRCLGFTKVGLLDEFVFVLLESFFAFHAAELVYFAFVAHMEFCCFFV